MLRPSWEATMRMRVVGAVVAMAVAGLVAPPVRAADKPVVRLATTSALAETGLLDWLLPKFTADTGVAVQVLAVDAAKAFELGKRGEADALLVDDRPSEEFFVSQRHATERREVMVVSYLLAGPRTDPAGIGDSGSAPGALKAIAEKKAAFVSRGDGSGAAATERRLWDAAGRIPATGAGVWYFAANASAPKTLALAGAKQAYVLIDQPSWLAQRNHYGLIELVKGGGPLLDTPYGVLVVNDLKHKTARYALAKKLADWLTGTQGRTLIAKFRLAEKNPYVVR
jgi:tungstate transport system substrate-binding protein